MIFVEQVSFPDAEKETDYAYSEKKTCFASGYPFGVLSRKGFERMDFEPVTLLCGGNGTGKSTVLRVLAQLLGLGGCADERMRAYVSMCRAKLVSALPAGSAVISSDDVFDEMLDLRAFNDGVSASRDELYEEWVRRRHSHTRLTSMADFEELRRTVSARRRTMSSFVRESVGTGIRAFSNGETAYRYFTERIGEHALYLLDEPENSLSAARQRELAEFLYDSARFFDCQFVISTHSPFLLAIPGAKIYDLEDTPVGVRKWTEIASVREAYDFFKAHAREFEED